MIVILTKEDKRYREEYGNNFNIPTEVFHRADLILYFDDYNPDELVLKDRHETPYGRYLQRSQINR